MEHKTRYSDSSLYDEVCEVCGATDSNGDLNGPCPGPQGDRKAELTELLASAGFMHPKELQRLALKLGNGMWCRHWYQWGQIEKPWIMALQIRSFSGSPVGCDDLKKHGFVRWKDCLYFINRAKDDGSPYLGEEGVKLARQIKDEYPWRCKKCQKHVGT